jgi:16S rRNA (uracil1498-N3)-methyltransferase
VASAHAAAHPAAAHVLVDGDAALLPDALRIDGPDGRHLARVRRLRAGEEVTVADGVGRWRPYRIRAVDGPTLDLEATGDACEEPLVTPPLAVAFALTKGVKPETVVRQLTELGVDEILPVVAHRSIARPRVDRAGAVDERLVRVAREAAMQSRRARLPRVAALGAVEDLAGRPGLLLADRGGVGPEQLGSPGDAGWTLLVGPEGGWAPEDRARLPDPLPTLGVGPHVLRAETAAVAGAAALAAQRTTGP